MHPLQQRWYSLAHAPPPPLHLPPPRSVRVRLCVPLQRPSNPPHPERKNSLPFSPSGTVDPPPHLFPPNFGGGGNEALSEGSKHLRFRGFGKTLGGMELRTRRSKRRQDGTEEDGRKGGKKMERIRKEDDVPPTEKEGTNERFRRWKKQLEAGFNVVVHGMGSKERVLERFAELQEDVGIVAVRGYAAAPMNPKHLLAAIHAALRGTTVEATKNMNVESLLDAIGGMDGTKVLLVVHSLDGNAVRGRDVQTVFSRLAQCNAVHLVASVDHINCPILWDKRMAAAFNWVWELVPTWEPHSAEKEFLPPLLSKNADETAMRGAALVLKSLTSNTRGVFRVLAENQLAKQGAVQGLPFMQFYSLCREQFLVSSELTLRTHLTEFKDHELIRTKRGGDGQEYLYVPFGKDKIEKMLQELP